MPDDTATDTDTATAWKETLNRLYEIEFHNLVRLAKRLVDSTAIAEDAVQDAFVRCHASPVIPAPGKELGYLRTAVLNNARTVLRRRQQADAWRPEYPPAPPSTEAETLAVLDEQAVRAALRSLPPRQRQVAFCRLVLDLSEAETARALTISTGSVKTHGSRARRALRNSLVINRVA